MVNMDSMDKRELRRCVSLLSAGRAEPYNLRPDVSIKDIRKGPKHALSVAYSLRIKNEDYPAEATVADFPQCVYYFAALCNQGGSVNKTPLLF